MGRHSGQDMSRDPCPYRILDDIGGAFGMGSVGGGAFHFIKGAYRSPIGGRLSGAAEAARMNSARIGGSFAVWGGLFSATDCALVYFRQKEDPWNSILSGAATGGILALRQGLGSAYRGALFGGAFLAMIEGAGIMLNKVMEGPVSVVEDLPGSAQVMVRSSERDATLGLEQGSASSSWFGGWFGWKKEEEEKKSSDGVKTKILESFESPMPPTFEFRG